MGANLDLLAAAARELTLFAAVGLTIGGLDDLLIDVIWIGRLLWRRATVYSRYERCTADTLPPPERPGRIAVFTGAWDESAVIGSMLATALRRWAGEDVRCYVATYPNDPATTLAVLGVGDPRVRLVTGLRPGPTTKAEALNRCWQALRADEAAEGWRAKAVLLHDAEDVVHAAEPRVIQTLIERFDLVQLPVLPIPVPGSRFVSAVYVDEFAEAHGKQLVVREALGAGMPSAGVGCAIGRDALGRMAERAGGRPFDEDSLTEDYELGLRLARAGGRGVFVAMPERRNGPPVAVRAYFPALFGASVRQKTRWITGIALAGWDRLGWRGGLAERWMRLRDRRAILSAVVLAASYAAFVLDTALWLAGIDLPETPVLRVLLGIVLTLLAWRVTMRAGMVLRFYGLREALWSVPRILVANAVTICAAFRAVRLYLRPGPARWDKTVHHFPDTLAGT